jgi:hypothetical protein
MRDPDTSELEALLRALGCHTAVLYGSRARGDATAASDWDAAGFRDEGPAERDARPFLGTSLDAWLYPTAKLTQPAELLHLHGGRVLFERDGAGEQALAQVREVFEKGPGPLPAWDAEQRRGWARKCIERARLGGPEGDFRRHWLLVELLEMYFLLRGRWFLGSKVALAELAAREPAAHAAFARALAPAATLDDVEALTARVIGP